MSARALGRRLRTLEERYAPLPAVPRIVVDLADAREGALPVTDADITATHVRGQRFERLPGESLEALCMRAEATIGPLPSGAAHVHVLLGADA